MPPAIECWISKPRPSILNAVHSSRPFFLYMTDFISSGGADRWVLALEKKIIADLRKLIGGRKPTPRSSEEGPSAEVVRPTRAHNAIHGSDGGKITARFEFEFSSLADTRN